MEKPLTTYSEQKHHVYNTLRHFPELHKTLKEADGLDDANRTRIKVSQKRAVSASAKRTGKLNEPCSRNNSEKIFSESQKLTSLCKSSLNEMVGIRDFTKILHESRISQRKVTLNKQLSHIYIAPPQHEYYINNTITPSQRPSTAPLDRIHPSATTHDLRKSPKHKDRPAPLPFINTDTHRIDYSFHSKPLTPTSPKRPSTGSNRVVVVLQSLCHKLSTVGFSFHPAMYTHNLRVSSSGTSYINNADALIDSIADCGLMSVLGSDGLNGRFTSRRIRLSREDLQERLAVVLGLQLTDSELGMLHSILFGAML
jgi:hypothetical protein